MLHSNEINRFCYETHPVVAALVLVVGISDFLYALSSNIWVIFPFLSTVTLCHSLQWTFKKEDGIGWLTSIHEVILDNGSRVILEHYVHNVLPTTSGSIYALNVLIMTFLRLPAYFPEDWRLVKFEGLLGLKIWRPSFSRFEALKTSLFIILSFVTIETWCLRLKIWRQHIWNLKIQNLFLCAGSPFSGNPVNSIYPIGQPTCTSLRSRIAFSCLVERQLK